jgi:glutamate synthase domain-containing protein 2
MKTFVPNEFLIDISDNRCIRCQVCVRQCSFSALSFDYTSNQVRVCEDNCVGCQRCVIFCPTDAILVQHNEIGYKKNAYWQSRVLSNIWKQAETGGALLTGAGNDQPYPVYFDHLLLDASQVTNPSIDPLREPMELRTFLGKKLDKIKINGNELETNTPPQVKLEIPIMFAAMSFGAISYNCHYALARAAHDMGTLYNTGEGGLHKDFYEYGPSTIVQVASGRFGVHHQYLNAGSIIEIKIGQGAKPGIGGHLPGEKINAQISKTRMIPEGTDALSPAPHHDIYSIEDLSQLIYALKEATEYKKLVAVKIAAVHNSAAIASGMVRAGADIIVLDGFRGGTGAAPTVIRDNVGIPIELALAAVDDRLRQEKIRNHASIVASGGIRSSADVIKAIALGADAVYIGTSALVAVGCTLCQKCYTGKCAWGIATQNPVLVKRLNPEIAARRLKNLLRAWSFEIKEILGAMGVNSIESLRGNRLRLRAVGLDKETLDILGVKPAGR